MSETVEVVVRLPRDIYDMFVKNAETIKANPLSFQTINAVLNGTVLPKGHGRLIDADELISKICGNSCGCHLEECGNDNPCYSVTRISSAQTIIEADNAESEVEDADSD